MKDTAEHLLFALLAGRLHLAVSLQCTEQLDKSGREP